MHISIAGGPARAAALGLALALVAAACSSATTPAPATAAPPTAAASSAAPSASASVSGASAAPSASAAAAGNSVDIQGFAFHPASLTVAVGTTVTWTNKDSADHTVTADNGSFDSQAIASGATFTQTFKTAGTFAYHCKIHPSMTATVVVQ